MVFGRRKNAKGQTAVEYAVILTAITVALIVMNNLMGEDCPINVPTYLSDCKPTSIFDKAGDSLSQALGEITSILKLPL